MILSLLKEREMYVLKLPKKVSGKYELEHINASGKYEQILSAEGINDKWQLVASVYSKFIVEGNDTKEVIAADGIINMKIPRTNERADLIVESDEISFSTFFKRKLNRSCQIFIGCNTGDTISYDKDRFPLLDKCRITLNYTDGKFSISECSGKIYKDGKIAECGEIEPGTQLFIGEIKIIIGKDYLCGNYENYINKIDNNIFSDFVIPKRRFGIEHKIADDKVDNLFYCSPRFYSEKQRAKFEIEAPPAKSTADSTPAILSVGPSLTMGMASIATAGFSVANNMSNGGELMNVAPTIVMAGSMVIGSVMWPMLSKKYEKRKNRKKESHRNIVYAEYISELKKKIEKEIEAQRKTIIDLNPDYNELFRRIECRDRLLWERVAGQPDFLAFVAGIGDMSAEISINFREKNFSLEKDPLYDLALSLSNEERKVCNVPIAISLEEDYIIGIIGERRSAVEYTRGILMQLAALHSYNELRIIIITDEGEYPEWKFARWLPHIYSSDGNIRFIAANSDDIKTITPELERCFAEEKDSAYLIISADKKLASKVSVISKILEADKYNNFSIIALYDEMKYLPKECKKVIELNGTNAVIHTLDGLNNEIQIVEQPTYSECEKNAISLANINLVKTDNSYVLPDMITFMELMDSVKCEHLNCVQRWQENNPVNSLKAPIGLDENGDICYLDLHQDSHGPHGLIAGMTGSGKSEFIMTYILSMALNYHPDEVSFILIDYKGGGMSKAFSKLPHLAGMITNLDGSGITRALISIESELKRREHLFAETSEKLEISNIDIYKYQKLYRSGIVDEPVSHLFVISDEFAELKSQQPEFMDKLISTARIGRSLGVHLILATQKPSGVVSDQIWSNSRFKACLKVQDTADSMDMIKRPDAAALSKTGRFYLQVGYNEMFIMGQSAWCGAAYHPEEEAASSDISISVIDRTGRSIAQSSVIGLKNSDSKSKSPKQLDTIVSYIRDTAEKENAVARPMWLPPLPNMLCKDEIKCDKAPDYENNSHYACVGIYDAPEKQEQGAVYISPLEEGNVVIYGSTGTGKLSFISTMICSMAEKYSPEDVNFYIIDFGLESLALLKDLPHVGEVITTQNAERIKNLLSFINREAEERKKLFFEYGGDYQSYCNSGKKVPEIIIVINNYGNFNSYMESMVDISLFQLGKLGISFVVTAQLINALGFNMLQNFKKRICMQLNDDSYQVILNKKCKLPSDAPKGRAIAVFGDMVYEFQTAFVSSENQQDYFKKLIEEKKQEYGERCAVRIPAMPYYYTTAYLYKNNKMTFELNAVPVGLTSVDVEYNYFDFTSKFSIVAHKNTFESSVIQGISELLTMVPGNKLTVVELTKTFIEGGKKYTYIQSKEKISEFVNEFFRTAVERYNNYDNCEKSGKALPVYEAEIIVFNGLSRIINALDAEMKEKLLTAIDKVGVEHGFRYVIYERVNDFSVLNGIKSYVERINQNDYIWIGDGYMEQYVLPSVRVSEKIDNVINGGYVMSRKKVKAVKLISTSFIEEGSDE